jgi:hypothetical protein
MSDPLAQNNLHPRSVEACSPRQVAHTACNYDREGRRTSSRITMGAGLNCHGAFSALRFERRGLVGWQCKRRSRLSREFRRTNELGSPRSAAPNRHAVQTPLRSNPMRQTHRRPAAGPANWHLIGFGNTESDDARPMKKKRVQLGMLCGMTYPYQADYGGRRIELPRCV